MNAHMMIEDIHWRVPGDPARWWSVEAGAYVESLPEGAPERPINSESELRAMLLSIGLPAPGGPAPYIISKDAIWRRATEGTAEAPGEAERMEAALMAQPVRLRRIYEGATHISSDDELFGLLTGTLTHLFGEERATALLAPTV